MIINSLSIYSNNKYYIIDLCKCKVVMINVGLNNTLMGSIRFFSLEIGMLYLEENRGFE